MNKNLRKIIAVALAIGSVSALAPATSANLLTTKAYAAENTDDEFDKLELLNKDDNNIKIYEDEDYDDKVDDNEITSTGEYYVKTSSSIIKIDKSGVDDKYVKVFKGTSDRTKGKDVDDDISISDDTTITVKIYNDDVDDDTIYYDDDENDDDLDCIGEYEIHVEYTGSSSDDNEDDADDYDDIYLEKLTVDGESITLSDSKIAYSYSVPNTTKEVYIKAMPNDEDEDEVTIADDEVYEDDSWKKKVTLKEGENKFEIEVENDDDDYRKYTLTINRAKAATTGTGTNNPTTTPPVTTVKANQWVSVNGKWQYNDYKGIAIKNQLFFDRNYGKTYYLDSYGNMSTGWVSYGGSWYYLGTDGAMKTGWQLVNGTWYYLNPQTGIMAYSTTIDGYKLGANGAWVK